MTSKISEAEEFLSSVGSDCGIANVNIGTSGAEIGVLLEVRKRQEEDVSRVLILGKPT